MTEKRLLAKIEMLERCCNKLRNIESDLHERLRAVERRVATNEKRLTTIEKEGNKLIDLVEDLRR